MRNLIVILAFMSLFGCQTGSVKDTRDLSTVSFYVGTYTGSGSRGIYKCLLLNGKIELTGLAAETENPSFLAFSTDGEFLLAVNENSPEGTVESYRVKDDSLVLTGSSSSGGAHPCYLTINKNNYVLTANYSSGTVGLLRMSGTGKLGELLDVQQHTGSGITERQQEPHAHSAVFEPGYTKIISADLGTDELWFSDLDTIRGKFLPAEQQRLQLNPGAGPRHLSFHPNGSWIYVVNELNSTVTLVKRNAGGIFEKGPSFETLPEDYNGDNYCADIHISSDGKFVYASNRGNNSIVIFKADQKDGTLKPVGYQSTCGEWPRNFALTPGEEYLLVANQNSDNIVSFKRDNYTGLIEPVDTISIPSPVCVLFR